MRLFFLYLSCAVVLIDTDYAIEVSRQLPDLFTEDLFYLIRRKRTIIRNYYIKDQIGMRRSGNHTEIMHFQFRIQLFKKLGYLIPHLIGKVIVGDHRVHMYGGGTVQALFQFTLDIVDLIMDLQDISFSGNFRVKRDDQISRTVVMDQKIMDP